MIKIGFSGTRKGMSDKQKEILARLLKPFGYKGNEFHHGDCIGADEQAHDIAVALGYRIVIHPPENTVYRAYCHKTRTHPNRDWVTVLPLKPYLDRNRDIVNDTQELFAAPSAANPTRSGTWSTIDYAVRTKKKVSIVFRKGDLKIREAARK